MNFRDVEYIVKMAECGSINRAAKELYVAQPSLSKCIKKVEDEYDIQLFYRNRGSSINLTVEGQAFLDMARPVLELYHHFEQQLQELKEKNRSRIVFGTAPAKGYSISSALFKNLYLEYDKYFLDFRTGKSLDLENGVLSGDLDMVMITVDSYREGLHYEELYENEEFIYLREGSPAAERATHIEGIDWPVLRLEDVEDELKDVSAILVPGGFGSRGVEGKIKAIQYARENKIPFLGICLGMQLALIEFARNVLKLKDANSVEFDEKCKNPIIYLIDEFIDTNGKKQLRTKKSPLGGTMRLGAYECKIKPNSLLSKVYAGKTVVHERHRHRYEANVKYKEDFEKHSLVVSGENDGLIEAVELEKHPFFLGVQFHPEFSSRLVEVNPVILAFIKAACNYDNA